MNQKTTKAPAWVVGPLYFSVPNLWRPAIRGNPVIAKCLLNFGFGGEGGGILETISGRPPHTAIRRYFRDCLFANAGQRPPRLNKDRLAMWDWVQRERASTDQMRTCSWKAQGLKVSVSQEIKPATYGVCVPKTCQQLKGKFSVSVSRPTKVQRVRVSH